MAYTLTATHSNDSIKIVLDTFPHPTLIKVTQAGTENEYWTAATNPNYAGQLKAVYDARGGWYGGSCYAGVELWYGSTPVGFCQSPGPWYAPPTVTWKMVQGAGELWWNRRGASILSGGSEICGRTSGTPCYTYTGAFDVTIERPQVEFKVMVSPSAKRQGTATQPVFKAEVTPGQLGGLAVPFRTTAWRWVPDGGGELQACLPPPQGTNPASCSYTPTTSGYMYVDAIVNGEEQTRAVYFSVVPCLTGDSLLDDTRLRRALRDAFDAANPNGPPFDRVERGGIRLLMPDGTIQDVLYPRGPADSPCQMLLPPLGQVQGTPILRWHIHPFRPSDPSDPLPYDPSRVPPSNCDQLVNEPWRPGQVFLTRPGPSWPEDYKDSLWPHIVVDKDNVYIVPPGTGQRPYDTKSRLGTCDPLSV